MLRSIAESQAEFGEVHSKFEVDGLSDANELQKTESLTIVKAFIGWISRCNTLSSTRPQPE